MAVEATRPWDLADRVQVQIFGLTKLQDMREEIRLLQIKPGFNHDPIVCDYTVHHLAEERKYVAISYTWGDATPTHEIRIVGQIVRVHKNCFEALRQARNHYTTILRVPYFWLDALCIDQNNRAEKSLQVQSMSSIFGRAHVVAVYLGLEKSITDSLDRELRCLDAWSRDLPRLEPDGAIESGMVSVSRREAYLDLVWPKLPTDRRERLAKCYIELATCSYWSRLWIVQELSAASKIELMCGPLSYDWNWLEEFRIERHLEMFQMTPMRRAMPLVVRNNLESHAWARGTTLYLQSFTSVLEAYRFLLCSDPRDRVYAVLSMMQQPRRLLPLKVDYEKAASQLAEDCIRHFTYTDDSADYVELSCLAKATTMLFEGLQLIGDSSHHPEGLQASNQPTRLDSELCEPSSPSFSITTVAGHEGRAYYNIADIGSTQSRLTLTSAHGRQLMFPDDLWPFLGRSAALCERNRCIFIDSQVVAVTCSSTQQGDILVPVNTDETTADYHLGLILRRSREMHYHIVGQAFVHPDLSGCGVTGLPFPKGNSCIKLKSEPIRRLSLTLTIDEWLMMTGLSRSLNSQLTGEHFQRILTNTFHHSYGSLEEVSESSPQQQKGDQGQGLSGGVSPRPY